MTDEVYGTGGLAANWTCEYCGKRPVEYHEGWICEDCLLAPARRIAELEAELAAAQAALAERRE